MKNIDFKNTIELIEKSNNILLLGHVNPDGDCIGSMVAMALGLRSLNKNVSAWLDEPIPLKYRFINFSFDKSEKEKVNNFDLIIITDTAIQTRVNISFDFSVISCPTLAIDHHIASKNSFTYIYANQSEASTSCIVFDILKKLNVKITKPIAEAIYTGIITDTGNFNYSNTNTKVFKIAEELLELGVKPAEISTIIYNSYKAEEMKLLGDALKTIDFVANGAGAIMFVSAEMLKKYGLKSYDTEDFVNYPRSIYSVKIACMLTESIDKKETRISFRSKNINVDVRRLAEKFNGGGHKCAAGARMNEPLKLCLPKLKKEINNYIKTEL